MYINPSKTIDELLTVLSYIIDIENNKNFYHNWNVSILSVNFAKNLKSKDKRYIFYAGMLHDIGAVGLTKHIIYFLHRENKPKQNILFSHPIIGAQLISIIPKMNPAAKLILDHHEWYNGLGYPRGRLKDNICYGAQLIRIADYIDILLQFNKKFSLKKIIDKIKKIENKQVSKKIVRLAINSLLKDKALIKDISDYEKKAQIFYKKKSEVGNIKIKKGIDAIGTALEVVAQIIDMKHPFTAGHSLRVSRYALAISLSMKLEHDEVTKIKWAGLLHDIGKLTTPRKILEKTMPLTKQEYAIVKQHPEVTHKIMGMIPSLQQISSIAVNHHEYYDGSGYPLGLKGKQSPLGAQILAVCDAFDAMTSNRPYRQPLEPAKACQEIKREVGKQFNPKVVKYALPIFRNLGL